MSISNTTSIDSCACTSSYSTNPFQPLVTLFAIPVAQLTIQAVGAVYQKGITRCAKDLIGRLAIRIPFIKAKYEEKLRKQFIEFQTSIRQKWEAFGTPYIEIPEEGLSPEKILKLLQNYQRTTEKLLQGHYFSGAIYPSALLKPKAAEEETPHRLGVEELFLKAFEISYLWNSLHGKEFAGGSFVQYQIIQMMAQTFGGKKGEIAGFCTSGGTESLMMAVRAYRIWAEREKGIAKDRAVIIAPQTIHAAVLKAAVDFHQEGQLVLVPTDQEGRVSIDALQNAVQKYRGRVVALFGSTPSYPKGKIDPIREMAALAHEEGIGLHVDACLGGFVIEHIHPEAPQFLALEGVTSLSVDTHKNGLAPKGSSVLITRKMPQGMPLAFYPIYSNPDWLGGIYGTPRAPGSQSCVPDLTAFVSLLYHGKKGYQENAELIHTTAKELAKILDEFPEIQVLGEPEVNVVAFQIAPHTNYEKGAIYGWTYLMSQKGFSCNNIAADAAHFCVTCRSAKDPSFLEKFKQAAQESLEELQVLNREKKETGKQFPGEAGLYGEIGAALHPQREEMSLNKYIENELFGKMGAEDAVRLYFLAQGIDLTL